MTVFSSASAASPDPVATPGANLDAQAGRLLAAALNHLLAQEPWAANSLLGFAGRVVRFELTPLHVGLEIGLDGQVTPAPAAAEAAVTVTVPLSALPLMAAAYANAGEAGVIKHVRLEGDAELANAVSQLVRHLRWEVDEDLSRLVGDVAAQRVVTGVGRLHGYALQMLRGLRDSVTEYLTDERPTLVRPAQLERMSADVTALRNDLARLEKRLERLERSGPAGRPRISSQTGPA